MPPHIISLGTRNALCSFVVYARFRRIYVTSRRVTSTVAASGGMYKEYDVYTLLCARRAHGEESAREMTSRGYNADCRRAAGEIDFYQTTVRPVQIMKIGAPYSVWSEIFSKTHLLQLFARHWHMGSERIGRGWRGGEGRRGCKNLAPEIKNYFDVPYSWFENRTTNSQLIC